MKLRKALKQLRKELHMSQTEFAAALHLNFTTINRWENGKNFPNRATAMDVLNLAKELEASAICIEKLKDALFPSVKSIRLDDLKYAQMDQINQLVNDSSNAAIVSDIENYEILYMNHRAGEMIGKSVEEAAGKKCYEYLLNRKSPCDFCQKSDLLNDRYQERAFTSERTGKHYLIRGKQIIWNETPAHIEYMTDMTELYHAKQQLERNQKMLDEACEATEIWIFTYSVKEKKAFPDVRMQHQCHLPPVIDSYPDEDYTLAKILPEYRPDFLNLIAQINRGMTQAKADIRTIYIDGRVHWMRFSFNTISYDEEGNPEVAVCSAQPIDTEKILESRLQLELEKQKNGGENLLGYVMANLSQNVIIEQRKFSNKIALIEAGKRFEDAIENALQAIESKRDQIHFRTINRRERLLQNYENGETTESVEFRRIQPNGKVFWSKNVLNMLPDPVNGDVILCEYSYDIEERKLFEGIMSAALQYNFEFYGAINMENDQISIVDYLSKKRYGRKRITGYTKECNYYCNRYVVEEDHTLFLKHVSIAWLKEMLSKQESYEFVHRVMDPEKGIRIKHTKFTYFDKTREICLVTRMDVTETFKLDK